ncbi:hypothetical protein KAV79_07685 [Candidatus Aerophobetes bacterium]|nr:hypothetical protein [Candidatus Aerophobetes bacterium]
MGTGEGMLLLIITIVLMLGLLVVAASSPGFDLNGAKSTYIPTPTYTPQPEEERKILRYNWSTGKMEYAYPSEQLRYNWSTGKMEYADPDEWLKYNWSTGEWEY